MLLVQKENRKLYQQVMHLKRLYRACKGNGSSNDISVKRQQTQEQHTHDKQQDQQQQQQQEHKAGQAAGAATERGQTSSKAIRGE